MLKKTFKYIDWDGNEREEDCYFNLTKTECRKMNFTSQGNFDALVKKIIQTQDHRSLWDLFEEMVLLSYGEKSVDGKFFIKNDEIREKFKSTVAFDMLMDELCTGEDKVNAFIDGILPKLDPADKENSRQTVAPVK